ncbi:hypothetical protein A2701_03375 [Candidatus Amesbacteria bacterium RIFCSPHIGHO2_01_FULL_47_34]|uniref:POTRA domain-containing protein n=4 Tax=Candidatus Amesiibacteriota TaxID=1752730 RepID=A0A1F4ZTJ4_9BACT|nr:MAG: hypothetical protein UX86_C0003G0014 [Candidatus Amesbacteria bacterium GW2011_GWC1_47_15]KKU97761.1 MAG: hypothetical protein UY28_C0014G0019 [Candidatus Amesbacteria bacterium GW2011_GWB1_48_13]OGC99796.1 MAG: hypothetical protein A2701_03375 [Candidatus Amesbacteria bacterium RIFCSPHIGHO2_01_FULL_47_34]OGD01212.1 MAG: hypothetical protein A2972_01380 [Candidatus Amesbacteria bacterium RIFCSPLOWO2_01_FULL_47_33]OGD09753.1 MAG: hypothetical protein A2395_04265 [Candidatus Amesbacteria 
MNVNKSHATHKKSRKKPLFISVIFLSVILSIQLFRAREVECYTQFGLCPPDYVGQLTWLVGRTLIKPLPVSKIRNDLKKFPEIKNLNVYRRLPSTLVLAVNLRRPIGAVSSSVLGEATSVDDEGWTYGEATVSGLPLLVLSSPPGQLSPLETQALKALSILSPYSPSRVVGFLKSSILEAHVGASTKVLIDIARPVDSWQPALQKIFDRGRIKSDLPAIIDLRFLDPVVSY